ncbi:uncharacterized protein LOC143206875 [Rhynchophorus ferrugineus]|uniref:uncharacterized protein LOC143206875 n=1 Tax=Rhynchophorus ferrugineus TaxID=354439 RepID=UPI003FCD3DE6
MPKPLDIQSQKQIASLINYFERERENGGPLLPIKCVRERVADALHVSMGTVTKISQKVKNNITLDSPKKKRPHLKRVTNQDNLDIGSIRNTIFELYEKRKPVNLGSIFKELRNRQLFEGCRSSLHTLLRDIGFKWCKSNPQKGLMELPDIAFKRIQFLKTYHQIKKDSLFNFVYLDETCISQNGALGHPWQDSIKKTIKTDEQRYIILHAGNKNGFIPGAELVFSSNSDYHGETDQNIFLDWFENQLLKNLEEPSVIIMDYAPYHSTLVEKIPTSESTKTVLKEWLTKHKLSFDDTMLKSELFQIVTRNKPEKTYAVDQMAEQYGHRILHLPPYHRIFNPNELIWGVAKNYYNWDASQEYTMKSYLDKWKESLSTITPLHWMNAIRYTEEEIDKWWNREQAFDKLGINNLVVDSNSDSDSESESD